MFPVSDYLPGGGAVGHVTRLARLTSGHVVQHVLHRPAVRQGALPHLRRVPCILLLPISSLTLVSMEQEDEERVEPHDNLSGGQDV
jgi:hypothetical protein